MKEKRYRIKLKNGRIIGPFFKKDIGMLYLKGHLSGDEKCQYFPVGDWESIQKFEELFDYIYKVVEQNSSAGNPENNGEQINEFEYEKQTQIDIDYDKLDKEIKSQQHNFEETKIVKKEPLMDVDKTVIKTPPQKQPEQRQNNDEKEKEAEASEEPLEKKEIGENEATVVSNIRQDMEIVQEEADAFELESIEKIEKKRKDEKDHFLKKNKAEKIKFPKKKKMTPIIALAIFVIFYFVLFDDDSGSGKINPKSLNIKIPISYRVENKNKAMEFLNSGKKLYQKGDYLSKLEAGRHFYLSVSHQYRDNKALGHLIRVYAELYPNVLEKDKEKSAINLYKIIQTAASRQLKDINITMGAALFYHHINKHETAVHIIENYLRLEAPSKKLFCLYLDVLMAAEKLQKGKKALEQVKNIVKANKNVPVEAYMSISKFYLFNEEQTKALEVTKKGIKKYPRSVPLLLHFAELKIGEIESLELSLKDPVFLKELALFVKVLKLIEEYKAENSPAYYAKYLEFVGLVSAIQGEVKEAVKLFKVALAINNSPGLRSKLATLNLEGESAAQKLILENKVLDLMKKSKNALKERKWKQAFAYSLEAVEYNENYLPAQLLLAEIQNKRGYYDNAIKTLIDLKKVHDKNKEIYIKLTDTYLDVKKFKNAFQTMIDMNRIPKLGKTAKFASLQGKYFLKKGNDLLASKWLRESISRNPLNERNYFELAKIYLRNRNYSKSKAALSKALALMPKSAEYHMIYATILYEYDSPEVAIGYLRNILESDKGNKDIIGQIAIFYYRNGQQKEFELYKKELEKSVLHNTHFYSFLVRASILDENYDNVKKYSELLLDSDPSDIEARMLLGKTLYDAKAYIQAIETFKAILERLKNYPQVYYYLAKIYMEQNKFEDALSLAEKEIKGNPELYYGHYIKGEVYRRMGKWPLAINNLEKAISIDTNAVETLIALGWISLRQNFVEKARELYLRAKNKDENNPEVRKQLGLIYQTIGQDALAVDELKIYLQLKPDAPDRRDVEFLIRRLSR